MYRGRSERRESALSTMIDLKGENQKCHIHPGGSARSRGYRWHFAKAVIQTKGNSNGDSAAGHVRVLRGADACGSRHRRVVLAATAALESKIKFVGFVVSKRSL